MRSHKTQGQAKTALFVMVRSPVAGVTKTRLAVSIGAEKAAEFYRALAAVVLRRMAKLPDHVQSYVFLDSPDPGDIATCAGHGFNSRVQVGDDLGDRLQNAFRTVFDEGAASAIAIASDTPDITEASVEEAILCLRANDVAIGPSHDGGYYLLGLNRPAPRLFHDVEWGTDSVLSRTLYLASESGLKVHLLPVLIDIDRYDDLKAWLSSPGAKDAVLKGLAQTLCPASPVTTLSKEEKE